MAAITALTTLANIIKVFYPDREVDKLSYRKAPINADLKRIMRSYSGGKDITYGLQTYRASSSRANNEGDAIVTPTVPQYIKLVDNPKNNYAVQNVSEEAFLDTGNDEAALVKIASTLPADMIENLAFHQARQLWAIDDYGAVVNCGDTTASTTVVLSSTANMRNLHRGMVGDIRNKTTLVATTNGDSVTINGIDEDNKTITISGDGVTTTAGTHAVYIEDEASATGPSTKCWNSIPKMVGTGNIHGVTVTTYPEFKSKVISSVGTLGVDDLQSLVDYGEARNKKTKWVYYMSPEVSNKYAEILLSDIRYDPSMLEKGIGGYPTTLAFNGGSAGIIPIVRDPLMPLDEAFLINWDALVFWSNKFMQWLDRDGSQYFRVSGYLQWQLLLMSRGNTMIINRPSCGKVTGISM